MHDKADIRIPFHPLYVQKLSNDGAMVDVTLYEFPMYCQVAYVNGSPIHEPARSQKWNTISSSISSVAVGFFPEGQGESHWPCVSIKASPSKILQGHNVFGTEDIKPGITQMLASLEVAFPKIAQHLDFPKAEIRYVDTTYSALIPSEYFRHKIIDVFDRLIPSKNKRSRYEGYLQLNGNSEYRRQKIYDKQAEVLNDLHNATRKGEHIRAGILSNPELLEFSQGRLRFEATTGYRAFENDGIPTNLWEFMKFHDWYEETHKEPLSRLLWRRAFDKLFSQIKGHTMKNVDDDHIRLKVDAKFITTNAKGKVSKRRANAVFRTYRDIKTEGYETLCKENNQTFFRNVKYLISAGISRAFLKSLDPNKPEENIVHLLNVIDIDFSQQRPDWYEEPTAHYAQERHLRLVS